VVFEINSNISVVVVAATADAVVVTIINILLLSTDRFIWLEFSIAK